MAITRRRAREQKSLNNLEIPNDEYLSPENDASELDDRVDGRTDSKRRGIPSKFGRFPRKSLSDACAEIPKDLSFLVRLGILFKVVLGWLSERRRTFFIIGLLFGVGFVYHLADTDSRQHLLLIHELRHVVATRLGEFLPAGDSLPEIKLETPFSQDLLQNITRTIAESLPSAESSAPAMILKESMNISAHFPIVILPGIVASNLESWARGGCAESYFRKKIWGDLSMGANLLLDKECWIKNLKLDSQTGMDIPGTRVRAVLGIDAADFFVPGYWVFAKIIENLAIIGYDSSNIHMASFDWRLSLPDLEKRDNYFSKLKAHIELSKRLTGKKTVALVHSMGGNVWYYFMKWVESKNNGFQSGWVNEHLHAVVSIAAPYLGVPKAVTSFLSGEMRDTAQLGWVMAKVLDQVLTRKERAELFRSWGGGICMLPKGGEIIWGNLTWAPDHPDFMMQKNRSFGRLIAFKDSERMAYQNAKGHFPPDITSANTLQLLFNSTNSHFKKRALTDYSYGIQMENLSKEEPKYWVNPLESALPYAPNVTFYNFYGVGKPTERAYYYSFREVKDDFDIEETDHLSIDRVHLHIDVDVDEPESLLTNGVQDSDGDGTVPLISLGFMAIRGWRWPDESNGSTGYGHIFNPGRSPMVLREYKHKPARSFKDMRGGPDTGDHVDILGNHGLTLDILKIVSNNAQNMSDRILSNLVEYASRVELRSVKI